MAFASDAKKIRIAGGPINYYNEYTTTNMYVERAFGGDVNTITITNDSSTDDVQISYNGSTLEGEIKAGETFSLNTKSHSSIYIKATSGGDTIRIWGW